jgi:hypothetical protein
VTDAWYQRAIARARSGSAPAPQTQVPRYQPSPGIARWEGHTQLSPSTLPVAPAPHQKLQQASVSDLLNTQAATGKAAPGVGGRLNPEPCPACGGNQYFATLGPKRRGPEPAPHCYNCGYNGGLFEQGLESSWQGAGT